jgi:[ribosomal protein S5]-alanine N-acetyltransferase
MKLIETPRLILRDWTLNDASDLFEYAKLPTVGPNAGWVPHKSIEESINIIKKFIEKNDTWAIELKGENRIIGSIGLHRRTDLTGQYVNELGYVLSTHYEGNGYMTEAANRIIAYAFEELKVPLIKVYHFIGNAKSERVIQKCGFIYDQHLVYKTVATGDRPSKSYHLTKKEYEIQRGMIK